MLCGTVSIRYAKRLRLTNFSARISISLDGLGGSRTMARIHATGGWLFREKRDRAVASNESESTRLVARIIQFEYG